MLLGILRKYGVWPLTIAGGLLGACCSVALTVMLDLVFKGVIVPADIMIGTVIAGFVATPIFYASLSLSFRLDKAERNLHMLAREDALTGLFNRRYFFEAAAIEFERSSRYGTQLSVMMMDLDFFKLINDQHGHQAGDQVLRDVAQETRGLVRSMDVVARYGGEEFVVMLPETGLREAALLAERLCDRINNFVITYGAKKLRVSVSIGVSERTADDMDFDAVLTRADLALYEAKAAGRNRTAGMRSMQQTL